MTTIEMIWGKDALRELAEPHSDPVVRAEFEAKMLELQRQFYAAVLFEKSERHDPLPSHYRTPRVGKS